MFCLGSTCDESGNFLVLKYLIDKNANFGAKTKNGWTILHFAAESSHMEITKYLIEEKHFGKKSSTVQEKSCNKISVKTLKTNKRVKKAKK